VKIVTIEMRAKVKTNCIQFSICRQLFFFFFYLRSAAGNWQPRTTERREFVVAKTHNLKKEKHTANSPTEKLQ
jgi:hypothetical protein